MHCTIYSHNLGFEKYLDIIKAHYPKANISTQNIEHNQVATIEIKGGLFSSSKILQLSYRQRNHPSYFIPEVDDSPLTQNLRGLYGFVASFPDTSIGIKSLFLQKIVTINSECSLMVKQGKFTDLPVLIKTMANAMDAFIFAQGGMEISKSSNQHFLDQNLDLIIDPSGKGDVANLAIKINSIYHDADQKTVTEDQLNRKEKNNALIESKQIKVNKNLPCIEAEGQAKIRSPKEIARRVCLLAINNLVAFDTISSEQAIGFLKHYNLWDLATPKEVDFLTNTTAEKKVNETWKCECIWTLIWALQNTDELPFPLELCNLSNIPENEYPILPGKDPNDFINATQSRRSDSEILDAADLYYRYDWACVNARVTGQQMEALNPSVVYERHYALNWLIGYQDQAWDDVSCDT